MVNDTPQTWNEASLQALEYIIDIAKNHPPAAQSWAKYNAVSDSLAAFATHQNSYNDGRSSSFFNERQAVAIMVDAGCMAMDSLLPITGSVDADKLHKLLCRKQHDYGHGNITKFGLVGVAVRMCDKIARAENITFSGGVAIQLNEPLQDSYEDIIGYAVIGVMLHRDTFKLLLQK